MTDEPVPERHLVQRLQALHGATLLAGDGALVLRGDSLDLSAVCCLAVARIASHHAGLIQSVEHAPTESPLRDLHGDHSL